jgi:hypothetical protein
VTTEMTAPTQRRRAPRLLVALLLVLALAVGFVACQGDDDGPAASAADAATTTTVSVGDDDAASADDPAGEAEDGAGGGTDGAATTSAAPPATAPPTTQLPAPPALAVSSVTAPAVFACSEAPEVEGSTQLTLRWTTTGAQSVTISIDSPGGTFQSGLPASGSLAVPAPCAPDSNTYYVTAIAADGSTTQRSTTTQGV